jgi:uncharacterized protein YbcI
VRIDDPETGARVKSPRRAHGDILSEISDGIVALLKECYGQGPTHTKTYYQDDLVVCLMRGGVTALEQTLLDAGRHHAVLVQRAEFQSVMRDRFAAVVSRATGRAVIGFMSANQSDPEMMSELFVLAPAGRAGAAARS